MKRIFVFAASILITVSAMAAAPNSKVIKSFSETFPNAANVKWNDESNGYSVSFTQNGNLEKIFYSKHGNFVCSWKYNDGKQLPTNLTVALQQNYKNSNIIGVTEFTNDQSVIYEVKLSSNDDIYSVKSSADGNIISSDKIN